MWFSMEKCFFSIMSSLSILNFPKKKQDIKLLDLKSVEKHE